MKGTIVGHLILKDFRLHRQLILISLAAGAIALGICQWGSEPAVVVGAVWFFISLIMVATMLPIGGIVNERKKQNLAFIMSLPVSSFQYTIAKLIATFGMFLIPWLALVGAAVLMIETRGFLPRGAIPILVILAFFPVVGYFLITAAAMIGETEGWGIAANVACSSSYGLVWYFLTRVPGLMSNVTAPAPVWNPAVLKILGVELVLAAALLGLTIYVQSRKRDFV